MKKEDYVKILSDQRLRLNNLYWIIDKNGDKVRFKMNDAQQDLFDNRHNLNIIPKARQRGFTTLICLYMLDSALFYDNVECLTIAHNLKDAEKIFRRKMHYPYSMLPEDLKSARKLITDSKTELAFNNKSVVGVASSGRSGTYQILHVSEFGKICARHPEKAKEIVTGALEAVGKGQEVFIESTGEGRGGYFYDFTMAAKAHKDAGKKLTEMDYKLHFADWHSDPNYRISDPDMLIPQYLAKYFNDIEAKYGVKLDKDQKCWYAKKAATLGELRFQEYPAVIEEVFHVSVKGAYFGEEITAARKEGRITKVPVLPHYVVDTWWDLGFNDHNSIWFTQTVGREVRVIDFYENSGKGLNFYAKILKEKGYFYGTHNGPHDIEVHEWTSGETRKDTARGMGIEFTTVKRTKDKRDAIEAGRNAFAVCVFDEERCDEGLIHLENYRKGWDERLGCFLPLPARSIHNHAADAWQTFAQGHGASATNLRKVKARKTAPARRVV